jgi:hypothetical protein
MAINSALSSFSFNSAVVADCGTATVSLQRPALELTSIGDAAQRFLAGVGGATANLEIFHDLDNATHKAMADHLNDATAAVPVVITLESGETFSGSGFCTGYEVTAQAGSLVRANVTIQFTSASGSASKPVTIANV